LFVGKWEGKGGYWRLLIWSSISLDPRGFFSPSNSTQTKNFEIVFLHRKGIIINFIIYFNNILCNGGKIVIFYFFLENKFSLYFFLVFNYFTFDLFITISFLIFIYFCNTFLVFLFFYTFFFKYILFSIFYILNIYYSILGLFIPFFLFLSLFFCNLFLNFFIYNFFWKISIQRLRKYCFTVTIATLFHSSATLIISLRSYIFFY